MEAKLTKTQDSAKGFNFGSPSPILSLNSCYNLTLVPTLTSALVFSNKLFKQFIKAYLESN